MIEKQRGGNACPGIILTQDWASSSEIEDNWTSLLLFPLFFFSSLQLQEPPRAPDTHIVRHSSRRLAALETVSLGEERASSRKTPALRSGDLKYPAAEPTNLVLCQVACPRPPELPCLCHRPRPGTGAEAECMPSRLFHSPVLTLTSHHRLLSRKSLLPMAHLVPVSAQTLCLVSQEKRPLICGFAPRILCLLKIDLNGLLEPVVSLKVGPV